MKQALRKLSRKLGGRNRAADSPDRVATDEPASGSASGGADEVQRAVSSRKASHEVLAYYQSARKGSAALKTSSARKRSTGSAGSIAVASAAHDDCGGGGKGKKGDGGSETGTDSNLGASQLTSPGAPLATPTTASARNASEAQNIALSSAPAALTGWDSDAEPRSHSDLAAYVSDNRGLEELPVEPREKQTEALPSMMVSRLEAPVPPPPPSHALDGEDESSLGAVPDAVPDEMKSDAPDAARLMRPWSLRLAQQQWLEIAIHDTPRRTAKHRPSGMGRNVTTSRASMRKVVRSDREQSWLEGGSDGDGEGASGTMRMDIACILGFDEASSLHRLLRFTDRRGAGEEEKIDLFNVRYQCIAPPYRAHDDGEFEPEPRFEAGQQVRWAHRAAAGDSSRWIVGTVKQIKIVLAEVKDDRRAREHWSQVKQLALKLDAAVREGWDALFDACSANRPPPLKQMFARVQQLKRLVAERDEYHSQLGFPEYGTQLTHDGKSGTAGSDREKPHTAASRVECMLVVFSRLGADIATVLRDESTPEEAAQHKVETSGANASTVSHKHVEAGDKIAQAKLLEIQQQILCWATDQKDPRTSADAVQACHAAAEQALAHFDKATIIELRGLSSPPTAVLLVCSIVLLMLDHEFKDFSWKRMKQLFAQNDLMARLKDFNPADLPNAVVYAVMPWICTHDITGEAVSKVSKAAGHLCSWARSMFLLNRLRAFTIEGSYPVVWDDDPQSQDAKKAIDDQFRKYHEECTGSSNLQTEPQPAEGFKGCWDSFFESRNTAQPSRRELKSRGGGAKGKKKGRGKKWKGKKGGKGRAAVNVGGAWPWPESKPIWLWPSSNQTTGKAWLSLPADEAAGVSALLNEIYVSDKPHRKATQKNQLKQAACEINVDVVSSPKPMTCLEGTFVAQKALDGAASASDALHGTAKQAIEALDMVADPQLERVKAQLAPQGEMFWFEGQAFKTIDEKIHAETAANERHLQRVEKQKKALRQDLSAERDVKLKDEALHAWAEAHLQHLVDHVADARTLGMQAVLRITKADLSEIKAYSTFPPVILKVLKVAGTLSGFLYGDQIARFPQLYRTNEDAYEVHRMLSDSSWLGFVRRLEPAQVNIRVFHMIEAVIDDKDILPENVARISRAAHSLAEWSHHLMTQLMVLHSRWPHGSDARIRGLKQRRRNEIEDQFRRDTMDSALSKKVTVQAYEPGRLYRFVVVPHVVLQIDNDGTVVEMPLHAVVQHLSIMPLTRYDYGQKLRFYQGLHWSDGAVVNTSQLGSTHEIAPAVGGDNVWLDLNCFNHAPILLASDQLSSQHGRMRGELLAEHETLFDAFSGMRLDVMNQTVALYYTRHDDAVAPQSRPATSARRRLLRQSSQESRRKLSAANLLDERDAHVLMKDAEADADDTDSSAQQIVDNMLGGEDRAHGYIPRRPVLLIGAPASGKSTLMKRFVVHILRDHPGEFVPLIITVIRLAQMMKTSVLELDSTNLLHDYVCVLFGEATPASLHLQQALMERRVVVLLDGMDEAGSMRPYIERFAKEQLIEKEYKCVITSRPSGYTQSMFRGCAMATLNPLNKQQQREMAETRIRDDRGEVDSEQVDNLMRTLADGYYQALANNPLMLSMIIGVMSKDTGLPKSRWQLYDIAIRKMLRTDYKSLDVVDSSSSGVADIVQKQWPQYHNFDQVMVGLEDGLQKSFDAYASTFDEMQRDDDNMSQILRVRDRTADSLMHASNIVDCETLRAAASEAQELLKRKLLQGQPNGIQVWDGGKLDQPFCWARAFVDPGIKGAARIEDKVSIKYRSKYGKDSYRRVRDVSRMAILCDTCSDMLTALTEVQQRLNIREIENRFASPTALGWRDITMLAEQTLSDGTHHVSELQIHHTGFAQARQVAHHHYSALREVLPKQCGVEAKDLDAVQSFILEKLGNSMQAAKYFSFLQQLATFSHAVSGRRLFTESDVLSWGIDIEHWDRDWRGVREQMRAGRLPILFSEGKNEADEERFRFSHLTFQEYLCAAELVLRVRQSAYIGAGGTSPTQVRLQQALSMLPSGAHCIEQSWWQQVMQLVIDKLANEPDLLENVSNELLGSKIEFNPGVRFGGAVALASMMRHNSRLHTLVLTNAELRARDVGLVVAGISSASGLRNVRFQRYEHNLADYSKSVVSFKGRDLGLLDAVAIGGTSKNKGLLRLSTLESLSLDTNAILSDAPDPAQDTALQQRPMKSGRHDDNRDSPLLGLEFLCDRLREDAHILTSLDLSRNYLDRFGGFVIAEHLLEHYTFLKTLNLAQTHLGGAGCVRILASLRHSISLESIDLSANGVPWNNADIFTPLREDGFAKLKTLELAHNGIGSVGARKLADVLSEGYLPSLTALGLSHNRLGSGVARIVQALSGRSGRKIQTLDFRANGLSAEDADSSTGCETDQPIAVLSSAIETGRLPDIQKLLLCDNLLCVRKDLTWTDITIQRLLAALSGHAALEHLGMANVQLGTNGMIVLADWLDSGSCPALLKTLDIRGNESDSSFYGDFSSGAQKRERASKDLMRASSESTVLSVIQRLGAAITSRTAIEEVGFAGGFMRVRFQGNVLDWRGMNLGPFGTIMGMSFLTSQAITLTSCLLSDNRICEPGSNLAALQPLLEMLCAQRGLTHLDLSGNKLGSAGVNAVAAVVPRLFSSTDSTMQLSLARNTACDRLLAAEPARLSALQKLMTSIAKLQTKDLTVTLDLCNNCLGVDGAAKIATSLADTGWRSKSLKLALAQNSLLGTEQWSQSLITARDRIGDTSSSAAVTAKSEGVSALTSLPGHYAAAEQASISQRRHFPGLGAGTWLPHLDFEAPEDATESSSVSDIGFNALVRVVKRSKGNFVVTDVSRNGLSSDHITMIASSRNVSGDDTLPAAAPQSDAEALLDACWAADVAAVKQICAKNADAARVCLDFGEPAKRRRGGAKRPFSFHNTKLQVPLHLGLGVGLSGLHMAVLRDAAPVVQVLLAAGADITQRDSAARTALHIAASRGASEVLQLLLGSISDDDDAFEAIAARDARGSSVAHCALGTGQYYSRSGVLQRKRANDTLAVVLSRRFAAKVLELPALQPDHSPSIKPTHQFFWELEHQVRGDLFDCASSGNHERAEQIVDLERIRAEHKELANSGAPRQLAWGAITTKMLRTMVRRGAFGIGRHADGSMANTDAWIAEHGTRVATRFPAAFPSPDTSNAAPQLLIGLGISPMHIAAARGDIRMLGILKRLGFSPLLRDAGGSTPLHCAAAAGHAEALQLLRDTLELPVGAARGSTIASQKDDNGRSVALTVVEALGRASRGADSPSARARGFRATLNVLMDEGESPTFGWDSDLRGTTPLHVACAYGLCDIVGVLVKGSPGLRSGSMRIAIAAGHKAVVETLLSAAHEQGSVNGTTLIEAPLWMCDGWQDSQPTPLQYAVALNRLSIVQLLVARGAKTDVLFAESAGTLIYLLQRMKSRRAIQNGISIEAQSTDHEQMDLLEQLLQLPDCDPNMGLQNTSPDQPEWNPLLLALSKGREDVAELLVRHGADANEPVLMQQLCIAAQRDAVAFLLRHGAEPPLLDDVLPCARWPEPDVPVVGESDRTWSEDETKWEWRETADGMLQLCPPYAPVWTFARERQQMCLELIDQGKLQSRPAFGGNELSDLQLALLHGFPELARRIIAKTGVPAPLQDNYDTHREGAVNTGTSFSRKRSLVALAAAAGDTHMVKQLIEAGHALRFQESAQPLALGLAQRRVMFGCKDAMELLATLVALGAAESPESRQYTLAATDDIKAQLEKEAQLEAAMDQVGDACGNSKGRVMQRAYSGKVIRNVSYAKNDASFDDAENVEDNDVGSRQIFAATMLHESIAGTSANALDQSTRKRNTIGLRRARTALQLIAHAKTLSRYTRSSVLSQLAAGSSIGAVGLADWLVIAIAEKASERAGSDGAELLSAAASAAAAGNVPLWEHLESIARSTLRSDAGKLHSAVPCVCAYALPSAKLTPLAAAVLGGHMQIVNVLLGLPFARDTGEVRHDALSGVRVDDVSSCGARSRGGALWMSVSALALATEAANFDVAKALLACGARGDIMCVRTGRAARAPGSEISATESTTPFDIAAAGGEERLAQQMLLNHDVAAALARGKPGAQRLQHAVRRRAFDVANALLEAGATPPSPGAEGYDDVCLYHCLGSLARHGPSRLPALRAFASAAAPGAAERAVALHVASARDDVEAISVLLRSDSALSCATETLPATVEERRAVLARVPDDVRGGPNVREPQRGQRRRGAQRPDAARWRSTPLLEAASRGHAAAVAELVASCAQVDASQSQTAVDGAAIDAAATLAFERGGAHGSSVLRALQPVTGMISIAPQLVLAKVRNVCNMLQLVEQDIDALRQDETLQLHLKYAASTNAGVTGDEATHPVAMTELWASSGARAVGETLTWLRAKYTPRQRTQAAAVPMHEAEDARIHQEHSGPEFAASLRPALAKGTPLDYELPDTGAWPLTYPKFKKYSSQSYSSR